MNISWIFITVLDAMEHSKWFWTLPLKRLHCSFKRRDRNITIPFWKTVLFTHLCVLVTTLVYSFDCKCKFSSSIFLVINYHRFQFYNIFFFGLLYALRCTRDWSCKDGYIMVLALKWLQASWNEKTDFPPTSRTDSCTECFRNA